jgi:hypothetical protein
LTVRAATSMTSPQRDGEDDMEVDTENAATSHRGIIESSFCFDFFLRWSVD